MFVCFPRRLQGRKDAVDETPLGQAKHHDHPNSSDEPQLRHQDLAPTPWTSRTPSNAHTARTSGSSNININADAVSTTTDTTAPPGPDVVAAAPSPNGDAATATATAATADPGDASSDVGADAAAAADTSGSGAIPDNGSTVESSDQRSDIETATIASCDDLPHRATFAGGVLTVTGPIDCSVDGPKVCTVAACIA